MKYKQTLDTPLGQMLAIFDKDRLYCLEFAIPRRLNKLPDYPLGHTPIFDQVKAELAAYFAGTLKTFKTPLHFEGTPFQQKVWKRLLKIPYGTTISYLELAKAIDQPTAFRAVANANGRNKLTLIIPCHRVINASGALGGYGGGLPNKAWLLNHETKSS